jgi:negative regulator of sigma E activity
MLEAYRSHLIFFGVFFGAAIPVLYYIYRKNPHPRFRPTFGEMSVMTLIAACVSGAMAIGLGQLFQPENDGSSLAQKPSTAELNSASNAGPTSSGPGRKAKPQQGKDGEEPPRRRLTDKN